MTEFSTKDKLLSIAARADQLARELNAIGEPIERGGAPDISFAASHQIGVTVSFLNYAARKLTKLAGDLQTNQV